jgi:hypothetical protein
VTVRPPSSITATNAYMIDKIHVQKKVRFPSREACFWNEETATE